MSDLDRLVQLDRLLESAPNDPDVRYLRAVTLKSLGRRDEADTDFDVAIQYGDETTKEYANWHKEHPFGEAEI